MSEKNGTVYKWDLRLVYRGVEGGDHAYESGDIKFNTDGTDLADILPTVELAIAGSLWNLRQRQADVEVRANVNRVKRARKDEEKAIYEARRTHILGVVRTVKVKDADRERVEKMLGGYVNAIRPIWEVHASRLNDTLGNVIGYAQNSHGSWDLWTAEGRRCYVDLRDDASYQVSKKRDVIRVIQNYAIAHYANRMEIMEGVESGYIPARVAS